MEFKCDICGKNIGHNDYSLYVAVVIDNNGEPQGKQNHYTYINEPIAQLMLCEECASLFEDLIEIDEREHVDVKFNDKFTKFLLDYMKERSK